MERSKIDVKGMSCSGCESRVEKALRQASGVKRADADHTDGTVEVVAESEEDVRQTIHDAGYEVTG
jgi:copper chaperone